VSSPSGGFSKVTYTVPITTQVSLGIYDVTGRKVRTLLNKTNSPGRYEIIWNGKDMYGKTRKSGIYFVSIKTGEFRSVKKLVMIQ